MRVAVLLIGALLMPALLSVPAHAQTQDETRVMNGFMRLGMTRDKAWCYSQIIGQMLGPQETGKAATIVETAPSGEVLQQGVVNAGTPIVNAFSAAHNTCGPITGAAPRAIQDGLGRLGSSRLVAVRVSHAIAAATRRSLYIGSNMPGLTLIVRRSTGTFDGPYHDD